MMAVWLIRLRSSTATRKFRGAFRSSAGRGCRFNRCSTTWKGGRPWTSSSISSRRSQGHRRSPRSIWLGIPSWPVRVLLDENLPRALAAELVSPRSIWLGIPSWPVRVLLDENLPRALAAELVGHDVSTVQAKAWSGRTNGELLRRPGQLRRPVEHGSRSSAPAESDCPSTAHRGHSSALEPQGPSEAACPRNSEHPGVPRSWSRATAPSASVDVTVDCSWASATLAETAKSKRARGLRTPAPISGPSPT